MLRLYVKILNQECKRTCKFYKHKKFKHTLLSPLKNTVVLQNNPTFSHEPNFSHLTRKIHLSKCLSARIFKDVENTYAYNILQTIPITDRNLFTIKSPNFAISSLDDFNSLLDQNWRSKSATEILAAFQNASGYCKDNKITVSDIRFDKLVDGLMDHVQDLTDTELSDLLLCLCEYPICDSYMAHNFHDIWSALDDVCCWKIANWSKETQFLFAEHWYRLHLGKLSKYTAQFVEQMTREAENLTKTQLVHIFFYINVCRKCYVDFNFESMLEKHIAQLSADEMAVIAMGFFKSQTSIRLKFLLGQMVKQLKKERETLHEISFTAILKILRYSTHVLLVDQLMDLLDHILPEIDRLACLCCIHIALLGTTLQFFHAKSLEKVSQKIVAHLSDPSQVRLKDMERLLLALTMFNFNPNTKPDIFDSICEELHREERRKEFVQHPRSLPCTLNFLSFRKIYSYDLMDQILHKDSYLEIYGKHAKSFSRDLFSLDVSIEVECPDYKGNRLDKPFRQKVAKWFVEYTPSWKQHKKLTAADRFFLEVLDTVAKAVHGHENLHTDHVLPNYVKSDIIVCQDQNKNFVEPLGFDSYKLGDVMRPPNSNLKWFAIVPLNWNNVIRNTTEPLGLINMKCRQLKAIGYEPRMVIWSEFKDLNNKGKVDYILNKISS